MRDKVKSKSELKKTENEIPSNVPCPCGSGKTYETCCQNKKFKYELRDGNLFKKIHIQDEAVDTIREIAKRFEEYYDRTPDENDYLMSFVPSYNNEFLLQTIYAMRECGIPEENIYGYYKADGLMPTGFNTDFLPDLELNEYEDYCNEYINLMNESKKGEVNALQFVMLSNNFIDNETDYIFRALISACYDFIHRHTKPGEALCFATKDSLDFCVFSMLKTVKTLESVVKLQKNHIPECIYSLGRSFFENYMYMCAINADYEFFNTKLLPLIDDEKFNLVIKPNGRISRKKAIEKGTGKEFDIKVIISQMQKYFKHTTDDTLYVEFYEDVCKYVHVDILSAKQYYSIIDIYDQIDPTLVASVSVSAIALMLLNEICECESVNKKYKKDFKTLSGKLRDRLVDCLTIIDSDPQHKIPLVKTLVERLNY